jgi:hypothetical protein
MQILLFVVSNLLGLILAWVDSRPTWDDTGVLVGLIVLTAAILGAIESRRSWLWALGVGVWIPFHNLLTTGNPALLVALAVALAGAYLGAGIRKLAVQAT